MVMAVNLNKTAERRYEDGGAPTATSARSAHGLPSVSCRDGLTAVQ